MTSSHHAPYVQGYTRVTMVGTKGGEAARRSKSQKAGPSSDCRLQPACMKLESVVIADQPGRGEYVLGPCTHRPSRQLSRGYLKYLIPTRKGGRVSGYTRQGGRSRNKAAVRERAAGSPPF
jgi:hypothetical protein